MATHPLIASEFNDLANSTWLITGFALAGAVTQPLVSIALPQNRDVLPLFGLTVDIWSSMENLVTYMAEGLSFSSHTRSSRLVGKFRSTT